MALDFSTPPQSWFDRLEREVAEVDGPVANNALVLINEIHCRIIRSYADAGVPLEAKDMIAQTQRLLLMALAYSIGLMFDTNEDQITEAEARHYLDIEVLPSMNIATMAARRAYAVLRQRGQVGEFKASWGTKH